MTYCHREFVHAQWEVILDDEFIDAWEHGIVVTCCDGVDRRFYPRIFTHSGDYPEKCVGPYSLEITSLTIVGSYLQAFETSARALAHVALFLSLAPTTLA